SSRQATPAAAPIADDVAPIVLGRFADRELPVVKAKSARPAVEEAEDELEDEVEIAAVETKDDDKRIRIWTTNSQTEDELEADDEEYDEEGLEEYEDGSEEGDVEEDDSPFVEQPELPVLSTAVATQERAPIQFTATKRSRPPMPRRKTTIEQELPADYVYPKRYTKPSLELFDLPTPPPIEDWSDELLKTSSVLEETLQTFGIEARVTDVTRGPTITRFELEPAPGIKVSRFLSLADDIALALKAHRVRVEAPIPGKGRVGIEVPNKFREPVVIRELLETRQFNKSKCVLPLTLGKDIAGEVMVADMTSMPHLLVAGATGAGKTVCVKTLLASMLCSKTPEELQLMLIDPKMVELSIFNDIPHLITPVVIDPKKAASALSWLILEMEERYRLFAHLRVRNIDVYNQSVENGEIELVGDDETQENESVESIRKLPYIVCVIDELADLMMLARAEVEDAIARIAQLARAVGIHLIIATQRPSVDVLTGVIKANFPCRISFQVSSRVDSRCILDEIGAERLIGKGDMLYLPAGQSKPTRIQGAFVSDEEMNGLIAYLKTQAPPQYRDEIQNFGKSKEQMEDLTDQDDELFDDAVRVVLETGQASISMVQRRLRVGYTRAARLIDMMELRGIVGPHSGSKAREILVSMPPNNEVA
ncbi:MAG TPA: DNA translocase FtsK, partial [Candidatus Hydrogenedentes bacterium]|nr:DNA translocase FtsK [Candidatus Hydrogenedentota bacterium]